MGIRLWIRGSITQAWLRGAPSPPFLAWGGQGQQSPSLALGRGGPQGRLSSRALASASGLEGQNSSNLEPFPPVLTGLLTCLPSRAQPALLVPCSRSRELQASPQPGIKSPEPCVQTKPCTGLCHAHPTWRLPEVGAGTACAVSTPRAARGPHREACEGLLPPLQSTFTCKENT